MPTLFVLSVLVLGTSCAPESETVDEINPSDLVIGVGTYDLTSVMSGSGVEGGVTVGMSSTSSYTIEVKGINPESYLCWIYWYNYKSRWGWIRNLKFESLSEYRWYYNKDWRYCYYWRIKR